MIDVRRLFAPENRGHLLDAVVKTWLMMALANSPVIFRIFFGR